MKNLVMYRVLFLLEQFNAGKKLQKKALAQKFNVSQKTIERDFNQIRNYLSETHQEKALRYDKKSDSYYFTEISHFDKEELLLICKILLESRALTKNELTGIMNSLFNLLTSADQQKIDPIIRNEYFFYTPPKHDQLLSKKVWQLSDAIRQNQVLEIIYQKNRGQIVTRQVLPVSLIFSEYYFYLMCYNPTYQKYLSYRVDRIQSVTSTDKKIKIPYSERLEDGQLRKLIHFMYGGEIVHFTFEFWGIMEAALDKIPTAKIIETKENSVITEADAIDTGIKMWLLSQGANVKVLSPNYFVEEVRKEVEGMLDRYK